MDKTQAAPFRQQLLTQQSELLAQLAAQRGGVIGRAEVAAEHFGQPEDPRAQVATERELEFALGERETAHLAAVEAALARIEAGTYGECTDCGAIARKRPSNTRVLREQVRPLTPSSFPFCHHFKKADS